jgi:hypothetical protein
LKYYVDEAGDGVLFGPKGRNRLDDDDASKFFMLGMVSIEDAETVVTSLTKLRQDIINNPLFASIPSLAPERNKTAVVFHAKDDHPEIRSKVFENLMALDFKFFAVIKDMRKVAMYVKSRNKRQPEYRYQPDELYDLTVRMLFKERFKTAGDYHVVFARRGKSDRTKALMSEIEKTRQKSVLDGSDNPEITLSVMPAFPKEQAGLQVADYCLWALQRCYERHESRFLEALWPKVSLIHDVDDPFGAGYGTYYRRNKPLPCLEKIKNRWI